MDNKITAVLFEELPSTTFNPRCRRQAGGCPPPGDTGVEYVAEQVTYDNN